MLTQYLGNAAKFVRPVAKGGYYNKGEGIRMALNAGAAPAGDFSSYHAEPLDPRSGATEALVMNFTYGILVNKFGERFLNEAPGPVDVNYDHISRAIGEQPDGICYVIFDQRIHDVPNWKKVSELISQPLKAAHLPSWRKPADSPPQRLSAQCKNLMRVVHPTRDSNHWKSTASPRKVSRFLNHTGHVRSIKVPLWLIPSSRDLFHIWRDQNQRKQPGSGPGWPPHPWFVCCGRSTGLYHQVYTGATSVMRGAVFGKIAGEHASKKC